MLTRLTQVLLACLLSVSLVQGQLYLSATGSAASTNCSDEYPCQSLAQVVQVYEQIGQSNSSLTIRWAAGQYYGANNTGIELPANTTIQIEGWDAYPGGVSMGVQSADSAIFTAYQGATVVIQNFPALNCISRRLLEINNTADADPITVHFLNGTFSAGTVLQSNESPGSVLVIDTARVRGIVDADFQTVQWSNSVFDHTVGLSVKQANVTGCTFTDNVNVFIDEYMTVVNSAVNSTAGRDITFTYKKGAGLLQFVDTVFYAEETTFEGIAVTDGASLSLESVQFQGPYTTAIYTTANQTTVTNCSIVASGRCLWGMVQNAFISQTSFTGCEQVAVGFSMNISAISASLDGCTFNATGPVTFQSHGNVTGTMNDCTFINPTSQVLEVNGDWSLTGVSVGPSSAAPISGNVYALAFGQQSASNVVSMDNCRVTGPLATEGTLYINQGNTQITNCVFDTLGANNNAGQISIGGNSTTVQQCTFQNIMAGNSWGALSLTSAQSLVQNSTFLNLSAQDAAGISVNGAQTTVEGCEFTNCTSQTHGGAIGINAANSSTDIGNSTFVQCGVDAIWVSQSTNSNSTVSFDSLTFTNCTPYAVDCANSAADVVYTDSSLTVIDGGSTIGPNCMVTSTPDNGSASDGSDQGSWWQFFLGGFLVILVSICVVGAGVVFYIVQRRTQASSYESLD